MHNNSFSNGGFKLNLKLVLHLQSQSLTESVSFLNAPLLQAVERWQSLYNSNRQKN